MLGFVWQVFHPAGNRPESLSLRKSRTRRVPFVKALARNKWTPEPLTPRGSRPAEPGWHCPMGRRLAHDPIPSAAAAAARAKSSSGPVQSIEHQTDATMDHSVKDCFSPTNALAMVPHAGIGFCLLQIPSSKRLQAHPKPFYGTKTFQAYPDSRLES